MRLHTSRVQQQMFGALRISVIFRPSFIGTVISEDISINELTEEHVKVNEVVENASIKIVKDLKEPEDEAVKEIADEVNYEDEEMPETTRVFILVSFTGLKQRLYSSIQKKKELQL